jgi:hypothetical protein
MDFHYPMMITNSILMVSIIVIGFLRFSQMDLGLRTFYVLTVIGYIGETTAYLSAVFLKTNLLVYAIFNITGIVFFCLYFNYTVQVFKKYRIGCIVALPSFLFGLFNLINCGRKGNINIYFMMYMAIVIIGMSLVSLTETIRNFNAERAQAPHHTWISIILIFLWTSLFLSWGLYNVLTEMLERKWIVDFTIFLVNILATLSILVVFIKFPKQVKNI